MCKTNRDRAYQFGKQHQHPFLKERNITKSLLDLIHLDVWGLAQTATFGGCCYYVKFIDDYSMHTWIFLMRHKNEVFTHFQQFKNGVEKETIPIQLEGYADADWAGYKVDRRSTLGFVFSLDSGAISQSNKKQPTFALSSIEAEYRGATVVFT